MANINAHFSFNQLNLDFYNLLRYAYDDYFLDNVNYLYEGVVYSDLYEWQWGGNGEYSTIFAGSNFSVKNGSVTGTVTGVLDSAWSDAYGWETLWGISGISVKAASLVSAISTVSTVDDQKLISTMLSKADTFDLSDENDTALGYGGNDTMYGYNGHDYLDGGVGNDVIYGGNGDDDLYGGVGNDAIYGGDGDDYIFGGAGKDTIESGYGLNTIFFTSINESGTTSAKADVITDYDYDYDLIDLSSIDAFAATKNVNDTFIWSGTAAFSNTTQGEVRYQKFDVAGTANDHTMIWIDNDKDTGVEMAIRLTGLHDLTASDFVL